MATTMTPQVDSWMFCGSLGPSGELATSMPRRRRLDATADMIADRGFDEETYLRVNRDEIWKEDENKEERRNKRGTMLVR